MLGIPGKNVALMRAEQDMIVKSRVAAAWYKDEIGVKVK
jgi:hypothetical protein